MALTGLKSKYLVSEENLSGKIWVPDTSVIVDGSKSAKSLGFP